MVIADPLYRQFLAESINIAGFSKSKGNLLEKVLNIVIPTFKMNAADDMEVVHRFMEEYTKDVLSSKGVTESIQSLMSEIDQTIYDLIGLSDDEIRIIEEQVSSGIYSDST
jgi:urease gamma subunit